MADSEKPKSGASRVRARKACKLCNARRVRCNVTEKQPCSNCELAAVSCESMDSRRGKYIRRPGVHTKGTRRRNTIENSVPHSSAEQPSSFQPREGLPTPTAVLAEYAQSQLEPRHRRFSESMASINAPTARSTTSLTSLTPISDNTVFLGESNVLTCVASNDTRSPENITATPEKATLCYPISQEISARASRIASGVGSKAAAIEYVTREGAFSFPVAAACDAILQSYFSWFHPCFPIVSRTDISNAYSSNTLSPLLLQAMLFVGSSYCPNKVISDMGFKDRHVAKSHFYHQAKLLYDADWEDNKIIVIQALFLMSFWRAGPLNEKDTRHWLGAAISLAQTRGFHRYTRSMDSRQAKLRRKIWWSLYVRDRQCNASLGLPSHIRDEDCDVSMLDHSDFVDDDDSISTMPEIFGANTPEHEAYAIRMAGLTILLGKIVNTEFAPRPVQSIEDERSKLKEELVQWRSNLPPEMSFIQPNEPGALWANMLHLAYNHVHILLHRSTFIDGDQGLEGDTALRAACTSTRIIEDMLSQNSMPHAQIHVITSLSSALCIHTIHLRRSTGFNRKLAEQRAQVCMIGLKELQKSWDVNNWVLQLFFQFLDESTAKKLHVSELEEQPSNSEPPTAQQEVTHAEYESCRPNLVTPAPSQSGEVGADPTTQRDDFGTKMNSAMDDTYNMPFYGIQSEAFNLDFLDDDLSQYFDGSTTPRMDDLNAQGLDFLSRCL